MLFSGFISVPATAVYLNVHVNPASAVFFSDFHVDIDVLVNI